MGLVYKASPKEILALRDKIFLEQGAPALFKNNFVKPPFSTACYGRNTLQDFSYDFYRLKSDKILEKITVHISRHDRWIKIFLNVFELQPNLESIDQLDNLDGMQFHLPPNTLSDMRLRSGDCKGIPLICMLFRKSHKLKRYFSERGLQTSANQLAEIIKKDMNNIDGFISRWHEIHKPLKTDWNGNPVDRSK